MPRILALFFLVSCGPAAEEPSVPSLEPLPGLVADGMSADDLSRVDVRGTATSIALLAAQVETLSPEARAEAAESLGVLTANCPYTRAALQLPFALHHSVMAIHPTELPLLVQTDWQYLQQGLATHVSLLGALGVDLAEPQASDHLYARGEAIVTREALLAAPDPVALTASLLAEIVPVAQQVDESKRALIDSHSDRVEGVTGIGRPCPRSPFCVLPGQSWNLGMQLGGWHDALRRVEPFVEDGEQRERVEAMLALYEAYELANNSFVYEPG